MQKENILNRFFISVVFVVISILFSNCKSAQSTTSNWQQMGPGGGGSTFIPTFSYQNPDNIFVKCDMTGNYLTNDGGNSYQLVNFLGGANTYAYDPNDADVIYAAGTYLYKSINKGKTWLQIFPKRDEIISEKFYGDHAEFEVETKKTSLYESKIAQIKVLKIDPNNANILYFAMDNFFFYTFDNGQTWQKENLNFSIENIYTNRSKLKDETYIFTSKTIFIFNKITKSFTKKELPSTMTPAFSFTAGTLKNTEKTIFYAIHHDAIKENAYAFVHSEIWTSIDSGNTWQLNKDEVITSQKSGNKPSFTTIACSENDAANAYVVTNNYDEKLDQNSIKKWYGALKTSNSGANWEWVWKGGGGSGQYRVQDANDAKNLKDSWVHQAFGGEFIQLIDVGISPQDGNIAIVTDWYRTMKTTDGGKTWKEIYSKNNGDSTFTSRGHDVTTTYGVHFDPYDKKHIAISYTDIGLHHSFDGGKSWSRTVNGIPNEWTNTCYWVAFDPVVKNKIWSVWSGIHDIPRGKMTRNPKWKETGIAKGGVAVSTDGGKTWKPTTNGMGDNSPTTSIVVDSQSPANNRTLYASVYSKGVFKSVDDGKTWVLKNKGIEANTAAFEVTLSPNGTLFLTVSPTPQHIEGKKGAEFYSGAVYKSTDGAESWIKLNVADGLLFPNGIAIDTANPNRIYLGCWSNISLGDLVGGDVVKVTNSDKNLDMPGGIFMSEDEGKTWQSIFDKNQYVYDVTVDPYHEGRLYCNTFNQAAYRSDNYGKTWKKIKGYDFHWGHRIIIDENDHEKIYITTFGSSAWHGKPDVE